MSQRSPSRGDLSECSTDQDYTQEELHVKKFAKHMLRGKIFVGTYFEKRLVKEINGYRDIVLINSTEVELLKDLNAVIKRIKRCFGRKWVGFTTSEVIGAPVGNCVWVELEQEVFGSYWYKIKNVRFRDKEILLQLKQVRPIEEIKKSELNLNAQEDIDVQEIVKEKSLEFITTLYRIMTLNNIKESIIFLSVLAITLFTGLIQLMQYLLDFSLKFMRETSYFLQSITPFAISVVHMFEKIIGGFYILLAMIWKDARNPQKNYPPMKQNMLTYNDSNRRNNMLTYQERGVYIKEIN